MLKQRQGQGQQLRKKEVYLRGEYWSLGVNGVNRMGSYFE